MNMNKSGEITVALAVILAVHLLVGVIAYKLVKEDNAKEFKKQELKNER